MLIELFLNNEQGQLLLQFLEGEIVFVWYPLKYWINSI